tara:strand:+ start:2177 stop:3037 length:861 start_codon:yes stop_codon:yes gene_type:complete
MSNADLPQQERYRFMDMLLLFKGSFTRTEIVNRFGIGEATASRSIASFIHCFPNVVEYQGPIKGYVAQLGFSPTFEQNAIQGLRYLANAELRQKIEVRTYGLPTYCIHKALDLGVVSAVTRAIVNNGTVRIEYVSVSSGATTRSIAPHSLFYANSLWYFRAYDFNSCEFRTFKFSRLLAAIDSREQRSHSSGAEKDDSWNRMRVVQLIPHPRTADPQAHLLDIGVSAGAVRELIINEACLGFVMTDLRVDCSRGHRLNSLEYPLALRNVDELESIDSMVFAPGFVI